MFPSIVLQLHQPGGDPGSYVHALFPVSWLQLRMSTYLEMMLRDTPTSSSSTAFEDTYFRKSFTMCLPEEQYFLALMFKKKLYFDTPTELQI